MGHAFTDVARSPTDSAWKVNPHFLLPAMDYIFSQSCLPICWIVSFVGALRAAGLDKYNRWLDTLPLVRLVVDAAGNFLDTRHGEKAIVMPFTFFVSHPEKCWVVDFDQNRVAFELSNVLFHDHFDNLLHALLSGPCWATVLTRVDGGRHAVFVRRVHHRSILGQNSYAGRDPTVVIDTNNFEEAVTFQVRLFEVITVPARVGLRHTDWRRGAELETAPLYPPVDPAPPPQPRRDHTVPLDEVQVQYRPPAGRVPGVFALHELGDDKWKEASPQNVPYHSPWALQLSADRQNRHKRYYI